MLIPTSPKKFELDSRKQSSPKKGEVHLSPHNFRSIGRAKENKHFLVIFSSQKKANKSAAYQGKKFESNCFFFVKTVSTKYL